MRTLRHLLARLLRRARWLLRRARPFDPYRTTMVQARLRLDVPGIRAALGCAPCEADPYTTEPRGALPSPDCAKGQPTGLEFVLLKGAKKRRD